MASQPNGHGTNFAAKENELQKAEARLTAERLALQADRETVRAAQEKASRAEKSAREVAQALDAERARVAELSRAVRADSFRAEVRGGTMQASRYLGAREEGSSQHSTESLPSFRHMTQPETRSSNGYGSSPFVASEAGLLPCDEAALYGSMMKDNRMHGTDEVFRSTADWSRRRGPRPMHAMRLGGSSSDSPNRRSRCSEGGGAARHTAGAPTEPPTCDDFR
eukprot:scaffold17616_cov32-Prasinocladus_malaysianus.AAC.2